MKLRVEVINIAGWAVQTEEFELSADAEDVLTTVNSQAVGQIQITAVYPIVNYNIPPGKIPRSQP